MTYVVAKSIVTPDEWRVESIDSAEGSIEVTLFSGPNAEGCRECGKAGTMTLEQLLATWREQDARLTNQDGPRELRIARALVLQRTDELASALAVQPTDRKQPWCSCCGHPVYMHVDGKCQVDGGKCKYGCVTTVALGAQTEGKTGTADTLRLCGFCLRWMSRPCGEQCCWSAADPTIDDELGRTL